LACFHLLSLTCQHLLKVFKYFKSCQSAGIPLAMVVAQTYNSSTWEAEAGG
jgi:hypothetical protein